MKNEGNPVVEALTLCGTTQKAFAEKYSLSRPVVTGMTSGTYPELSEYMLSSLEDLLHSKGQVDSFFQWMDENGFAFFEDAYSEWQYKERVSNAGKYQIPPEKYSPALSPFASYVQETAGSSMRFCKDLKVNPSAVSLYSKGKTKTMPYIIQKALNDIDYGYKALLVAMQANWVDENL